MAEDIDTVHQRRQRNCGLCMRPAKVITKHQFEYSGMQSTFQRNAPDQSSLDLHRKQGTKHLKIGARSNRKAPVTLISAFIGLCGAIITVIHFRRSTILSHFDDTNAGGVSSQLSDFTNKQRESGRFAANPILPRNALHPPDEEPPHYHTLQCQTYGGPSEKEAQEMVYWQGAFVIAMMCRAAVVVC